MKDNNKLQKEYAYVEPKQALNTRIASHAKYSNFNLHEWIKNNFNLEIGDSILDFGCGNGNYTSLFSELVGPNGLIVGVDKNVSLIEEARKNFHNISNNNVNFLVGDFDQSFPKLEKKFDWIFSIYSLYYTEDIVNILEVIKEHLKPKGCFVVIGPGPENTKDLNDFNYQITGLEPRVEHIDRIQRITKEFHPLFLKVFGKERVYHQLISSVMEFPEAESYAKYYWSTLLWRQSTENRGIEEISELKQKTLNYLSVALPAKINKQLSCLIVR